MILLRNFGVLVAAILLSTLAFPAGVLYTLYRVIRYGGLYKLTGYLENIFLFAALCLDWIGNQVCRDLFNDHLILPGGYQFGQTDSDGQADTISKVLGVNKLTGMLTPRGKQLADLLNFIQKDHVELAAGMTLPL